MHSSSLDFITQIKLNCSRCQDQHTHTHADTHTFFAFDFILSAELTETRTTPSELKLHTTATQHYEALAERYKLS